MLFLDPIASSTSTTARTHVGDALLKSVAARLMTCVRESDTASRQGGDEFVVPLPDIGEVSDAAFTAQKINEVLSGPARCRQASPLCH